MMDYVFDRLLASDYSLQLLDGYEPLYSRGLPKNRPDDWEQMGSLKIFGSEWKMRQRTSDVDGHHAISTVPADFDRLDLQKLVGALDDKYSLLIDLVYFQGYTQTEVERQLGIPMGTIKTRLRTAILALRKVFEEEETGAGLARARA